MRCDSTNFPTAYFCHIRASSLQLQHLRVGIEINDRLTTSGFTPKYHWQENDLGVRLEQVISNIRRRLTSQWSGLKWSCVYLTWNNAHRALLAISLHR